ncbi:hypothetical protein GCM10011506_33850 [Marivirga lumbricoides]|uniref:histidine kinase n=1 Tax=Marivirga lumbricoides TaxID=1046115 RepID=A0ABQ1MUT1_9BACT|nr:hypothetical protein GCM10011506_33850 [Marivirga lumbricoides]
MHSLGSDKFIQLTSYLLAGKYNYRLLDEHNITHFKDYCCYFVLVEERILYVFSAGEADRDKSIAFFQKLLNAYQFKGSKSEKLTLIVDATGLKNMPFSARKKETFLMPEFINKWKNILYINDGIAKVIFDMFDLQKPTYLKGIQKVRCMEEALDCALNNSSKKETTVDTMKLQSLNKQELIQMVQQLQEENIQQKKAVESQIGKVFEVISQLSWENINSVKLNEVEKDDPFASVYGILNTTIRDYSKMKDQLLALKKDFKNRLSAKVGQTFHQEASLRAIFDSLDSVVWYVDSNFNLVAFNKNFTRHVKSIFGLVPEVGMNILEQPQIANRFEGIKERVGIALSGKESVYIDQYKEGEEVVKVVSSKILPVVIGNEVIGAACLTTDITESYFNKEKIERSEKILASVNKNISEALYRSTAEKGLIYVNEAFVTMFGYNSKEELYNNSSLPSLYADAKDRKRLGERLIREKQYTNVEVLFKRKNGETFTGLLSSMLTVGEDGINYFDGAIRDVTAIKIAQERMKEQNEELTKLNSELDSFVYSASHDLKAPLSSVKGLIYLAKLEKDKEKTDEYLHLIEKSVTKLDEFIEDIINLSRNSRLEVSKELIEFAGIVEDTLDNFKYLPNFERIRYVLEIDQQCEFYSDKRRVMIIFSNIISNAIRYYNPKASNPYLKVEVKNTENEAVICVSDNGIGIDKRYQKRIFEMFFRATDSSKGSGIGLYIVKETIDKLNGQIKVKSVEGEGSEFKIILPNQRKEQALELPEIA